MHGDDALIRALLELADGALNGQQDPGEHLYLLAEHCVDLLDATASAVLVSGGSSLDVAAATDRGARTLGLLQARTGQGPCVDAHERGETVRVPDLARDEGRWAAFAQQALGLGYRSVFAHPLRIRQHRLGAVQILWSQPRRLEADGEVVARGLAAMASVGIDHARTLSAANSQIDHLRLALDTRAAVEQAKVLLAERLGTDQGEAFDRMRRYARDRNKRVRAVAQRYLNGELDEAAFASE